MSNQELPDIYFWDGFIEDVEKKSSLLYSDTDSIYAAFKTEVDKYIPENWDQLIEEAEFLADRINSTINKFMTGYMVERAGLDPEFQTLFFKVEMVALRMLQYMVKKTYSLSYIYDEGKRLDKPSIKNTGGHIKKSSTPKISKDMLKDIVYALLTTPADTIEDIKQVIFGEILPKYNKEYKEAVDKFDIPVFGIPYKFGFGTDTVPKWVVGAKFFNTFFHDELRPGSSMYSIYITYNRGKLIELLPRSNSEYKMTATDVDNSFDMLSVSVEQASTFIEKYKNVVKELEEKIEFRISFDSNYDYCIGKKIAPYKELFKAG